MAVDMMPVDYEFLMEDLKKRIRDSRVHAALSVNRELILLYWHIGRTIISHYTSP